MSLDGGWTVPPTDANLNSISQEYKNEDITEATGGFCEESRLGHGTYGSVYRGMLRDGTEVAVKVLNKPAEAGFREEVEVLSRFRHPNLVILMGFARNRSERYLVYELLPGGDLCERLQRDAQFRWWERLTVALDASLGLSHLHGSRPQVFHRDIKTQNILLDRNGTGKMADFGLALLAQRDEQSLTVEHTSGTIGYADPMYIRTGQVTERTEVYSFGMVLLEVLTKRPPALQHSSGRIEYQFSHLAGELSRVRIMIDKSAQWPEHHMERLGALALRCISDDEPSRPNFVEVVSMLRKIVREGRTPSPPAAPVEALPTVAYSGAALQQPCERREAPAPRPAPERREPASGVAPASRSAVTNPFASHGLPAAISSQAAPLGSQHAAMGSQQAANRPAGYFNIGTVDLGGNSGAAARAAPELGGQSFNIGTVDLTANPGGIAGSGALPQGGAGMGSAPVGSTPLMDSSALGSQASHMKGGPSAAFSGAARAGGVDHLLLAGKGARAGHVGAAEALRPSALGGTVAEERHRERARIMEKAAGSWSLDGMVEAVAAPQRLPGQAGYRGGAAAQPGHARPLPAWAHGANDFNAPSSPGADEGPATMDCGPESVDCSATARGGGAQDAQEPGFVQNIAQALGIGQSQGDDMWIDPRPQQPDESGGGATAATAAAGSTWDISTGIGNLLGTSKMTNPEREEEIRQLQAEMGFTRHQVTEAFKRCSTAEAAIDWILSPDREWNQDDIQG